MSRVPPAILFGKGKEKKDKKCIRERKSAGTFTWGQDIQVKSRATTGGKLKFNSQSLTRDTGNVKNNGRTDQRKKTTRHSRDR